ncbi:hypothetical protein Ancab_017171 [Ancistrocladus abbreviatus]
MQLQQLLQHHHLLGSSHLRSRSCPPLSVAMWKTQLRTSESKSTTLSFEHAKEAIQNMFNKVELSVSAYDTAWVAMVPSANSPDTPCFPGSINWILENQVSDGSWGLPNRHPLLMKDALSSTLACVLALKRWNVGEEQMTKGLDYIMSNFSSVMDETQHSPVGFDIIFPSMIDYAIKMDINLHLAQEDFEAILQKKDLELQRVYRKNSGARNFYLAFVSEGLGNLQDWEMVMAYQRENGSLFNSPSTTAAALSHLSNSGFHSYLSSVLNQFGNAVPTVYPLDVYARLRLIDLLEMLGIDRHFREDIKTFLDKTFRLWMWDDDEIFADIATCAMAFRLLRGHGYNVSSGPLSIYSEEDYGFDRFGGHLKDINDALELFKASQFVIYPDESYLEKQNLWTGHFLKQQLSNHSLQADGLSIRIIQEVDDALKSPHHATLERLASRKCIEHYNFDNTCIFKTSFHFMNSDEVLLKLAAEEFNYFQSIHVEEFKQLKRWYAENRLDCLTFARQKVGYCYFSAVATIFSPELADARMSWAKNGILTTVVDDFFDIGSSEEEQTNLIKLVEQWDAHESISFCSEKVKIIYSALHSTICEIGDKAYTYQDRSVTGHIFDIWLNLMKSMQREAEMVSKNAVPTIDEYMKNGYLSFALGPIVLPALYLVGPKLSEEVISSSGYHKLFELMSTCGRLLNDIRGFKREAKEGKLNAVSLHLLHSSRAISEGEAMRELERLAEGKRRELLKLVLQGHSTDVPRACSVLFWKMSQVLHLFYRTDDGFTSQDLEGTVKAILQDPIAMPRMIMSSNVCSQTQKQR